MVIEYFKIKSFGNVDNARVEPGEVSSLAGKGGLGIAALTAFELFIFYGVKECAAEVQPYLDSAKGPVAGGYAVVAESLAGRGVLTHVNANDGSCEGLSYPEKRCFTVQFHPEAHAGPRDTAFLCDRFIRMMAD